LTTTRAQYPPDAIELGRFVIAPLGVQFVTLGKVSAVPSSRQRSMRGKLVGLV
jgi:hypothetical protein